MPTQMPPSGGGAEGSGVMVIAVTAPSAPAGICTEVPSDRATVPPSGPTDCVVPPELLLELELLETLALELLDTPALEELLLLDAWPLEPAPELPLPLLVEPLELQAASSATPSATETCRIMPSPLSPRER